MPMRWDFPAGDWLLVQEADHADAVKLLEPRGFKVLPVNARYVWHVSY